MMQVIETRAKKQPPKNQRQKEVIVYRIVSDPPVKPKK